MNDSQKRSLFGDILSDMIRNGYVDTVPSPFTWTVDENLISSEITLDKFIEMFTEMYNAGFIGEKNSKYFIPLSLLEKLGVPKETHYLTNIKLENREAILEAARRTGFNIEFKNHPMPEDVNEYEDGYYIYDPSKLVGYGCVVTHEPSFKDHTPFWNEYDRIKDL